MKKIIVAVFLFAICFSTKAQPDTATEQRCNLSISLLTCSPGTELYSTFGHSALRVIDQSTNTDIVFNYGTFDFDDPHFYEKFIRGKLLYFVSVSSFNDFMLEYEYEGRGVIEQVLDLSCEEKQNLLAALNENAKEENKYYKYDFVYDNCTTRLRDMVFKESKEAPLTNDIRPEATTTFRNLIHAYLDKGKEYWSKLGIDILLGMPLDKKISNSEAMFLPDYLLKGFDSTTIGNKKLVSEKITLLDPVILPSKTVWFSPMVVFLIFLLIIAVLTFMKTTGNFFKYFDFILFSLTGTLGLLLLFMWFGTDHPTCKYNLNLLWAFPAHIVISFFINKKINWVKKYFFSNAILLVILLIFGWFVQGLNPALIPLMLVLLLRSLMRYKNLKVHA
ncbi:MAG TPA: DUF4105 domain-containing protein [Chitinophagaceae bacterium]|nr:DUF4105 domain-containing protein [Chitinophagaceae bacterium]